MVSIIICITLLISASALYASIPLRQKYKQANQPRNLLPDKITDGTESESECHVVPLSNLVAPVRELFPILVTSQESLNNTPVAEYVPDWFDYYSATDENGYEDFINDSVTEEDNAEVWEKNMNCALKADLLARLVSRDEMTQSPTSTASLSYHASIDSFIKELQPKGGGTPIIKKKVHPLTIDNSDELSLTSSIAYFPRQEISNPGSPASLNHDNKTEILVGNTPSVYHTDGDSVNSGSQTASCNESHNSTPNITENVLHGCLQNLLAQEHHQIFNDPSLEDSQANNCTILENPLSECSDDLILNDDITSECSVSHVIPNVDYIEPVFGNANTLHDNVGIDRQELIDQIRFDSNGAIEQIDDGIDDYSIRKMKRQISKVSQVSSCSHDLINQSPVDHGDCLDQFNHPNDLIDQVNTACDQSNHNSSSITTNHYTDLAIQIEHSIQSIDLVDHSTDQIDHSMNRVDHGSVDISVNPLVEICNDDETQSNDYNTGCVSLIDL